MSLFFDRSRLEDEAVLCALLSVPVFDLEKEVAVLGDGSSKRPDVARHCLSIRIALSMIERASLFVLSLYSFFFNARSRSRRAALFDPPMLFGRRLPRCNCDPSMVMAERHIIIYG